MATPKAPPSPASCWSNSRGRRVGVPTLTTPETLLTHLDRQGAVRQWLSDCRDVLCVSGDRLVDLLISRGFQGDSCERAEFALEVLEQAGWIVRGKLDPIIGRSGLAFSRAWPSVSIEGKRRCWCWCPGSSGGAGDGAAYSPG